MTASARLVVGDCRTVLPSVIEASIDSVVTDPPYHLTGATRFGKTRSERGFMNKTWDGGDVAFQPETWETVARVVRPGGYLLAFGGPRTAHRLTCAIEDAGWEIVDTLMWLYGQGFPKHKSKLKPAYEPIILARKEGPVYPLAIDDCRILVSEGRQPRGSGRRMGRVSGDERTGRSGGIYGPSDNGGGPTPQLACVTCSLRLANQGQLEMHIESGTHVIAAWCPRHGWEALNA